MTLSQKSGRSKEEKSPAKTHMLVVCWGMLREGVQRFRTSGSAFEHFDPRARLLCRAKTHTNRARLLCRAKTHTNRGFICYDARLLR